VNVRASSPVPSGTRSATFTPRMHPHWIPRSRRQRPLHEQSAHAARCGFDKHRATGDVADSASAVTPSATSAAAWPNATPSGTRTSRCASGTVRSEPRTAGCGHEADSRRTGCPRTQLDRHLPWLKERIVQHTDPNAAHGRIDLHRPHPCPPRRCRNSAQREAQFRSTFVRPNGRAEIKVVVADDLYPRVDDAARIDAQICSHD
jgi:hypothetical protein